MNGASQKEQDQFSIVTGAGQGLGRAYVDALLRRGDGVLGIDVDDQKLADLRTEFSSFADLATLTTDLGTPESAVAIANKLATLERRVTGIVNNAAIFSSLTLKPFWEIDEDEWSQVVDVNVNGVWRVTKASVPFLASGASIVNISSAVVHRPRAGYAHYVASKAAVIGMTRAMARELGERNVRANAITPGPVATGIPRASADPDAMASMVAQQCLQREATPSDLVGTVLYLTSPSSEFITGQTINVDGGWAFH